MVNITGQKTIKNISTTYYYQRDDVRYHLVVPYKNNEYNIIIHKIMQGNKLVKITYQPSIELSELLESLDITTYEFIDNIHHNFIIDNIMNNNSIDYYIINTIDLVRLLIAKDGDFVECSLGMNGIKATHFIYVVGGKIYDEGIDGEMEEYSRKEFRDQYRDTTWYISGDNNNG